jgi:hypothetical protein
MSGDRGSARAPRSTEHPADAFDLLFEVLVLSLQPAEGCFEYCRIELSCAGQRIVSFEQS